MPSPGGSDNGSGSDNDSDNENENGNSNSNATSSIRRLTPDERLKRYKPGSILRVKLKNFLTYAEVEFNPGPRLNVVIGPNGTGKSTILCAICLGLGGQPPLLGRADDARTFIKNDEEIAEIEIELAPPPNTQSSNHHIIRRVIDRNKGSERGRGVAASTYFINGETTNLKSVQKLVSETYRIAIDNLCTFLPQDRVGSFSGFDSKMLLQETEKSVSGTQHLYEEHMMLIDLEKEILESDTNLHTIQDDAAKLQREVDKLEREKELMEERKRYMEKFTLLKQKFAWVRFDTKRDAAVRMKEERKTLKNQMLQAREKVGPIQEEIGRMEEELGRNVERKHTLNRNLQAATKHHEGNIKKAEMYHDKIDDNNISLTEIDSLQRRAQIKVDECRTKLQQNEDVLRDFPPEQELVDAYRNAQEEQRRFREQMKDVKSELSHHQQVYREKKGDLDNARYNYDRMKDEKTRRNERIFNSDNALFQAYQWVDQNRKMFRRQVWGPVVCEITTQDVATSNCLEQHVRNAVLKSFVVECQEDYNLLYREVREKSNIPINIQVVHQGKSNPVERRYSDSKMEVLRREHGVKGYLDEVFTAPDAIMQALRNTSNVQSVLIGDDQTTTSLNRKGLMTYLNQREGSRKLQASCIFATDGQKTFKYTSIISRYSGKASLSVDEISPARMLKPGVAPEEKARAEDQMNKIERELQGIQPKMDEVQRKYEDLQKEGQQAYAKMKDAKMGQQELQDAKNKVASAKRKLRSAEESVSTDTGEQKRKIKEEIKQNLKLTLSSLEYASAKYDEILRICCEIAGIDMNEEGKRQKRDNLVDKKIEIEMQSKQIEDQYKAVSAAFNREKQALGALKDEAIRIAPIQDEEGNDLPLKDQLNDLPDNMTELEESMDDALEKINQIHDNPEVMRIYEEQKRQLQEIKDQLANMSESKELKRQALKDKREPWEASLKNIVEKVNVLFSVYMKELGCAGEVALHRGDQSSKSRGNQNNQDGQENLGNFKDWGVEIRVKFREKSDLQVLSAQVHSGGERSVSTIMFLMAMQNMMVSPFRCVDEINQGLDERNERLVFSRIVQNSTKPPEIPNDPSGHCGQYFLITPKLLPNLTDMENEDITVHCIFNGPFNFKHYGDWSVDTFLDSKRALSNGDHGDEEIGRRKRVKTDED